MNKKILATFLALATAFSLSACKKEDDLLEPSTDDDITVGEGSVGEGSYSNIDDLEIKTGEEYAVVSVKDYGDITIKLYPGAAPVAVENFIELAKSGFYEGKVFHRVMKDFMIQAGSRNGDGMSTAEDPSFAIEPHSDMRHFYGALCMANAGGINGTQFYIVNDSGKDAFTDFAAMLPEYKQAVEEINNLIAETESDEEIEYYNYFLEIYGDMIKSMENVPENVQNKYNEVGGVPFLDGDYTVFGQTVDGFDVIDKISAVEVKANESNPDEISVPLEKVIIEKVEIKVK